MISESIYQIRYLLIIELSLLGLFSIFGLVPFSVAISLIVLGIILFLSFNYPVWAVYVLMFSILVDSLIPIKASQGFSLLVAEFFLITITGLCTIRFLLNLDKKPSPHNLIILWIPFLIWGLTGLFVAVDQFKVISFWKNYFAGFFSLALTFYAIKDKSDLKFVLLGIIIWGFILSLLEIKVLFELGGFAIGLVGLFLKKNLLTLGWGRSNYLAAFFVIIIPTTIGYLLYAHSRRLKVLLIIFLSFMAFGIIITLSRGGILALIIALIILSSQAMKGKRFIPFLSVFLIIVLVVLLNPLTYVLIERTSSLDTSGSVYSRINFYEDVWRAFLSHPITGVGFANLSYYATFILPPTESPSAHNIVLGMLGETGLIGASLFFILLGTLVKNVFSSFKSEKDDSLKILKWCCFSSIIGGISHSLVEPTFESLQYSIIFWCLAGVFLKLDLLKDNQ